MNSSVPRVAVLPGDPAGVGPEMTVRLLHDEANRAKAELVLIADPLVLQAGERIVGQGPVPVTAIERLPAPDEPAQAGRVLFLALEALVASPRRWASAQSRRGARCSHRWMRHWMPSPPANATGSSSRRSTSIRCASAA